MIDRTPRGKIYAGDNEFDALQLRPVRTSERIVRGRTIDGRVVTVKQTITVCDFGRVDRTVAQPDAMIDHYEGEGRPDTLKPMQARTFELIKQVAGALADGPLSAAEIAEKLDMSIPRIAGLIRHHQEAFDVVDRSVSYRYVMREGWDSVPVKSSMTALAAGRKEAARQRHEQMQARITAHMREHGPSTVADLLAVVGCGADTLRLHLNERIGTVYEREQASTGDTRLYFWRLAGASTPIEN